MRRIIIVLCTVFLILSACGQPGNLPLAVSPNPVKGNNYVDGIGQVLFRPLKIVCYIDTAKYNPLNVLDYTLDSGLPFFDYVILGGAFLRVDAKGYYLAFSDDFKRLLAKRSAYIEPLQNRGIKVLLGIKSDGAASFGHLDEHAMYAFSDIVYDALKKHRLDGVEFYDDAGPSAYPDIADYIPSEEFEDADEWLAWQWVLGGRNFANILYIIRESNYLKNAPAYLPREAQWLIRDEATLFVRESKYGRFLSHRFYVEAGYETFSGTSSELTAGFNPFYDRFPLYSSMIVRDNFDTEKVLVIAADKDNEEKSDTWMLEQQYGPLAIDLDGGRERNIGFPILKDAHLFDIHTTDLDDPEIQEALQESLTDWWFYVFQHGPPGGDQPLWQYVFFNNLKSVTEAAQDDYYRVLDFDDNLPPTDWYDTENPNYNPSHVPVQYIFNELTKRVLNQETILRPGGGNHEMDW